MEDRFSKEISFGFHSNRLFYLDRYRLSSMSAPHRYMRTGAVSKPGIRSATERSTRSSWGRPSLRTFLSNFCNPRMSQQEQAARVLSVIKTSFEKWWRGKKKGVFKIKPFVKYVIDSFIFVD